MLLNANKMLMLICRDTLPFKMKPVFPEKDPRCSSYISWERLKHQTWEREGATYQTVRDETAAAHRPQRVLFWCICHVRIWYLAPSYHKWSLLLLFPSQLITLIFCFLRELLKMLTWEHHVYNLWSHLLSVWGHSEKWSAPNLSWDWMCVGERAQLIDNGDCSSVSVKTQWISHCLQHCQSCITQINGWCENMALSPGVMKVGVWLIRISSVPSISTADWAWLHFSFCENLCTVTAAFHQTSASRTEKRSQRRRTKACSSSNIH